MEVKITRTEKKGFLGRQRYVSDIAITFTESEREFIRKKGLKNFSLYDYKRDGGPQGTTGYYDEMPLFMFLDRSVPVETSDPQLSELIEGAIAHHLKSLKDRFRLEGSFGGSETSTHRTCTVLAKRFAVRETGRSYSGLGSALTGAA